MSPRAVPRIELAPGYRIPRIVNGCWQLASDHRPDPSCLESAVESLGALAELGLTAFDAADIYPGVEEKLGALRRRWAEGRRDPGELRLHTKLVPDRSELPRIDRGYVERITARSLRRLGVERLDLVQFHWWDFAVPGWLETAGWLDELRREGRIRHLGVTNFDVAHLRALLDAGIEIVSNQVQYSLLDRRPERGLAQLCERHGIGLLGYGALAGGFLSERWLRRDDPGSATANRSLTKYRLIIEETGGWAGFQDLLELLDSIAATHDVSVANVATRWVLDRPGVAAVILGAASSEHAESNLRTSALELAAPDLERIERQLVRYPGPEGDVYSVERQAEGAHAAIMKTELNRLEG